MRLIHLSDVHHQLDWSARSWVSSGWRGLPGRFELHGMGRLARFQRAHEGIRRLVDVALESQADGVLLSGDLTAMGDRRELTEVRALLAPLIERGKLFVIPGNHDRYTDAPGRRGFESVFAELVGAEGWPYVKLIGERFALVGIDSTQVSGWSHYFFGRIGAAQLGALDQLLKGPQLAGRTVIVMVHHGPHGPSGRFDWRESGLLDAGRLLDVVRDRPVVVVHGHSHHRFWHRAAAGVPHVIGGGSSTEHPGYFELHLDDHRHVEAIARPLPLL